MAKSPLETISSGQFCPELMPCKDLVELLRAARVPLNEECLQDKESLLHLCNLHICPKPQRSRFRRSRLAPTGRRTRTPVSSVAQSSSEMAISPNKRAHDEATQQAERAAKVPRKPVSLKRNLLGCSDGANRNVQQQKHSANTSCTTGTSGTAPSPANGTAPAAASQLSPLTAAESGRRKRTSSETNGGAALSTAAPLVKRRRMHSSSSSASTSDQPLVAPCAAPPAKAASTFQTSMTSSATSSVTSPVTKKPRKPVTWP
eukprot:scpid86139/ scgid20923/ 